MNRDSLMKNIKVFIICFCATLLLQSCDDYLDITPEGQVKRDELLSTAEGVEDAMYGVYASLRASSLYGQELSFSTVEVMANNLWCYGNTSAEALGKFDYEHSGVTSVFSAVWQGMYKNISNVNSVLKSPLIKGDEPSYPFNIYKGEALGLRAFMHFDLVRLFCKQITDAPDAMGIPYATEFSLKTPQIEKLADNYKHIIMDLLAAEQLLANEDEYRDERAYMLDRQIHFNLYAVQATLARVYLTMGDKDKALEYALKVIENSGCSLKDKTEVENDLAGVLSNKETVFGVYYADFFSNVYEKLQLRTSFYSLDLRDGFIQIYDTESGMDFRQSAYFTEEGQGDSKVYRLSKLTDIYELRNIEAQRPENLILGINLIRIPEMYYIVAEVLLDSNPQKALEYFDAVIEHRGITPYSQRGTSVELTQEMINQEYLKEYIGEGLYFYNMKRQGLPITSYNGEAVYASDSYVVPIPDEELEYREY